MSVERGFFRIAWVASALGLIAVVAGLAGGSYFAIRRASIERRMSTNPEFLALMPESQDLLRQELTQKYPTEDWLLAAAAGGVWFVLVWVVFLTIRWIVRGFTVRE